MVKSGPTVELKLRIPKSLRDELRQAAAESNRSLNQEASFRLANTLQWDREFLKSAVMQEAILDALAKGRRPRLKRK